MRKHKGRYSTKYMQQASVGLAWRDSEQVILQEMNLSPALLSLPVGQ